MSIATTTCIAGTWRKRIHVLFKSLHMFQELLGQTQQQLRTSSAHLQPALQPRASQSSNSLAIHLSPGLLHTSLLTPEIFSTYPDVSDLSRPSWGRSSEKSCCPESSFPPSVFMKPSLNSPSGTVSPQCVALMYLHSLYFTVCVSLRLPRFIGILKLQLCLHPQCLLPKWLSKHC